MSDPQNYGQWSGRPDSPVNETPGLVNEITMTSADPGSTIYGPISGCKPYVVTDTDRQTDLALMCDHGFNIDWSETGRIGSGKYGSVYFGRYGLNIYKSRDKYGHNLEGVKEGDPFAAKYIEANDLDKIVAHENEKQIMRDLWHRNIVRYRMAINLGQKRPIDQLDGRHVFDTYSRMFLIMEWADHGNLRQFMKGCPQFNGRLFHTLLSDLIYGLQYLHNSKVYHGDIQLTNALVFNDPDFQTVRPHRNWPTPRADNRYNLVAKWADFGQSVSLDTVPGQALPATQIETKRLIDLQLLREMLEEIMGFMESRYGNRLRVPNIGMWLQIVRSLYTNITMNKIVDQYLKQFPFHDRNTISTTEQLSD